MKVRVREAEQAEERAGGRARAGGGEDVRDEQVDQLGRQRGREKMRVHPAAAQAHRRAEGGVLRGEAAHRGGVPRREHGGAPQRGGGGGPTWLGLGFGLGLGLGLGLGCLPTSPSVSDGFSSLTAARCAREKSMYALRGRLGSPLAARAAFARAFLGLGLGLGLG